MHAMFFEGLEHAILMLEDPQLLFRPIDLNAPAEDMERELLRRKKLMVQLYELMTPSERRHVLDTIADKMLECRETFRLTAYGKRQIRQSMIRFFRNFCGKQLDEAGVGIEADQQ